MIQIKNVLYRVNPLVAAATLILAALVPVLAATRANALALTNRSLMVSSTVPNDDLDAPDGSTYTIGTDPEDLDPGDPRNGAQVTHIYTFTPSTTGDLGGFTIEYCETAFEYLDTDTNACTAAALLDSGDGFDASAWDEGTLSIGGEDYTVEANADNFLTVTADDDEAVLTAGVPVTITFTASDTNYFVNPSSSYRTAVDGNTQPIYGTYFAHISTFNTAVNAAAAYADNEYPITGLVDEGTVTNNVTQAISIYTRVQETLNFSVEGDEANDGATSIGTGCDPLTAGSLITMGDTNNALSPTATYTAKSYFRLATNSANGAIVHFSGDTLRSGAYSIAGLTATATASDDGTEQFGLGVDTGDADNTLSELVVDTDFNDAANDNYAYDTTSVTTPFPLAESTDVVQCETGAVEYVANISTDTPAGIYTTKINYIASPSY